MIDFAFEWWHWPVFFLTGLLAGFVDAIAGGGGLICLPMLLGIGLEPQHALGTNKLQATFGSASASWHYARARAVDFSDCGRGILFTILGAVPGTYLVRQMDPDFLRRMIPLLLISIALYVMLRPRLGEVDSHARMKRDVFYAVFGLGLGFYDGFFGPGTGTLWTMSFMLLLGFNMMRATGYTKVMNLTSNICSLVLFVIGGEIYYSAGLTMGAGQLLGARIGSSMVVTRGTKFIRPVFVTVVIGITLKLLYDAYLK